MSIHCAVCHNENPPGTVFCGSCGARVPAAQAATAAPNISFYVFMVTTTCTECGNPLMLDGPQMHIMCRTCQSQIDMPASEWKDIFGFPSMMMSRLALTEGQLRTSASIGGEFTIRIRWGPQRPLCTCGTLLDLRLSPPGTIMNMPCACGLTTPTFPPPDWLKQVVPNIMQVWGALREGTTASEVPLRDAAHPVSFACPECGANLKVTTGTARILECSFCKNDLYLPDALWFALHPVRKRQRWYVAFG